MSSFALDERLLSCHLPLSSEVIAANTIQTLYADDSRKIPQQGSYGGRTETVKTCTLIRNHL